MPDFLSFNDADFSDDRIFADIFHRHRKEFRRRGICSPICRHWRHAPQIPRRLERNAHNPKLTSLFQRPITRHSRRGDSSPWQVLNSELQAFRQRAWKSNSAALRIHH